MLYVICAQKVYTANYIDQTIGGWSQMAKSVKVSRSVAFVFRNSVGFMFGNSWIPNFLSGA